MGALLLVITPFRTFVLYNIFIHTLTPVRVHIILRQRARDDDNTTESTAKENKTFYSKSYLNNCIRICQRFYCTIFELALIFCEWCSFCITAAAIAVRVSLRFDTNGTVSTNTHTHTQHSPNWRLNAVLLSFFFHFIPCRCRCCLSTSCVY